MTEFTLEDTEMRAAHLVVRIAGDLLAERRRLARSVGGLFVSGWSGEALEHYRTACTQWSEQTDRVLTAATTADDPLRSSRGNPVGRRTPWA